MNMDEEAVRQFEKALLERDQAREALEIAHHVIREHRAANKPSAWTERDKAMYEILPEYGAPKGKVIY